MEDINQNLAETLAREMKQPIDIGSNTAAAVRRIALPPDWTSSRRMSAKRCRRRCARSHRCACATPIASSNT